MHGIADLHLDIISLANNTNVGPAHLAQQVKRRMGLLAQSQPQAVLLATLADRLVNVLGHTIEAVRGTRTIDPLVGALVVVITYPVVQSLTGVRKRSEHRFFQELAPDRLPEPLDLSQGHRVMGGRPDVLDTLLFQGLLEPSFASPGHELAAVITEDLPRGTPLADRSFDHLHHRVRRLLTVKSPANQVSAVIVDDPDQVDLVHTFEVEGEDVGLPHRVGHRTFEPAHLSRAFVGYRRRVAHTGGVDRLAHLLRTDGQPLFRAQLVADTAHTVIWVLGAVGNDPFLEFGALFAYYFVRGLAAQTFEPLIPIQLQPIAYGRRIDVQDLGNVLPIGSAVDRFDGKHLGLEDNWGTAADPLPGRDRLARVRSPGDLFLCLGRFPE